MRKFRKFVIGFVTGAVAAVVATGADANGRRSIRDESWQPYWSGFYIGVNGGRQTSSTELSINAPAPVASIDGLSGRGAIYGVQAGAGWQFRGTPFYLGLDASYQFGEADFDVNVTGLGSVLSFAVEPQWKVGPRIGFVFNNNAMLYAGYQYARGEASVGGLVTTIPGLCTALIKCDVNLHGWNAMVGLEVAVASNVSLALQYDWTRYDTENLLRNPVLGVDAANVDIDVHAFTARVNLRLPGF